MLFPKAQASTQTQGLPKVGESDTFLAATWSYLTRGLLIAALASMVPIISGVNPVLSIGSLVMVIVLAIALSFFTHNPYVYYAFTVAMGYGVGVNVSYYLHVIGPGVIFQALLLTAIITYGMSTWAMQTQKDLSRLGLPLFGLLIALILGSLGNIFFFQSSAMELGISFLGAGIFSLYIAYDMYLIKNRAYPTPVRAAFAVFLDIVLLFMHLLRLLAAMRD
ncbi:Bax inhibitor-1/YccA family protein [Desulfurispira natronophila]|uniref:FtsH-binding integral membrane protein n=1 Tax=Desulfurispira natronophila TaxID=682562 RepID=A0A7W7Y6E4_9BACT|nr:Bax inhibitor-1/YccA family protein [Desulfurispira natronophila]MBB5022911.1 FtsH-binding integral membrane protein [Desulfurispira natronophila]